MKTFYYTEEYRETKIGVHKNVEQRIYKLEKGVPKLLATHKYNAGDCLGSSNEAFKALCLAGILPSKYNGKSSIHIPHKMYKM